jgi:hypothetical protein
MMLDFGYENLTNVQSGGRKYRKVRAYTDYSHRIANGHATDIAQAFGLED